eukprot:Rhum_TRINITY_DN9575_c0_g1::Rhum_TRINITY_DN9575_c0_g1_i1::g.34125::m.34125
MHCFMSATQHLASSQEGEGAGVQVVVDAVGFSLNPAAHVCVLHSLTGSQHISSVQTDNVSQGRLALSGLSNNQAEHVCVLHGRWQHSASVQTEGTPGHVMVHADALSSASDEVQV